MRILCFLALSALLLSGCVSKLEIGVDVYNGPLVNQEEIQSQQLIGLVYGTHSLLTEVKHELERRNREKQNCVECDDLTVLIGDALQTYQKDPVFGLVADLSYCAQNMLAESERIGTTSQQISAFFSAFQSLPQRLDKRVPAPKSLLKDAALDAYLSNRAGFLASFPEMIDGRVSKADLTFATNRLERIDREARDFLQDAVTFEDRPDQPALQNLSQWAKEYADYFGNVWKKHTAILYTRLPSFFDTLESVPDFRKISSFPTQEAYLRFKGDVLAQMAEVVGALGKIYEEYRKYDSLREELKTALTKLQTTASSWPSHDDQHNEKMKDQKKKQSTDCPKCDKHLASDPSTWKLEELEQAQYLVKHTPNPLELARDDRPDWKEAHSRLQRVLGAVERLHSIGTPGRGKNYKGLDQLMRAYISAPVGPERIRSRRDLLLELTRFGEKLRMLGTYNKAIFDTRDKGAFGTPLFRAPGANSPRPPLDVSIEQALFLLETIGNSMVTAADGAFARERKKIRSIVQLYQAAEALQDEEYAKIWTGCVKLQFERLGKSVEKIRAGTIPFDILAITELHDDTGGLFAMTTRLKVELLDKLKNNENDVNKGKIKALREALQELLDQRSDISDISPARDFLRTVDTGPLRKQNGQIVGTFGTHRPDDELVRRMVEVVERQMWRNINTVEVSASGKANYVIVKDAIGNWYIKSYSNDPSELIAAAFGGAKAVAEFALAAQTGGTSEAMKGFLTNVVKDNKSTGNTDMLNRQLEDAWSSYTQSKYRALKRAHQAVHKLKPTIADGEAKETLEKVFAENAPAAGSDPDNAGDRESASTAMQEKIGKLLAAIAEATKGLQQDSQDKKKLDQAKAAVTESIRTCKESLQVYLGTIKSISAGVTANGEASQPAPNGVPQVPSTLSPKKDY